MTDQPAPVASRWDGRPENPNKNGLHYITDAVALWRPEEKRPWTLLARTQSVTPEWLAAQEWAEYRGPCPSLDEYAALMRELEAARAHAADGLPGEDRSGG